MTDRGQQLLSTIKDVGVREYKTDVLKPAIKKLLARCVDIESQLIEERSAACCNFRDLRLEITGLLDSFEKEDAA